jgi:thiamine-phosphate pyrophosphorylase
MNSKRPFFTHPVYVIINVLDDESPLPYLNTLLSAGATLIQLRDKRENFSAMLETACACVKAVRSAEKHDGLKRKIIINDYAQIALDSLADGLHIGQDDISTEEARHLLGPDLLLGLSTSNLNQINQANFSLLDYLAIGPIFDTPTKQCNTPLVGLDTLSEACRICPRPLVAIGGIACDNAAQVFACKVASIAVISVLRSSPEPAVTFQQLTMLSSKTAGPHF